MSTIRVTMLPVPIEIDLPEGWEVTQGTDDLEDGLIAVAWHPRSVQGVRATITVTQEPWPPGETLDDLADLTVARIARTVGQVGVRSRDAGGNPSRPWLVQLLDIRTWGVTGKPRDLVQVESQLGVVDDDPTPTVVVRVTLSASAQQSDHLREDFEKTTVSMVPRPELSSGEQP